ncbi:hypothetical protein GCM10010449_08920 [Streptomyces rectiviolaceus]|uniref:Uncharacterized protein n=1 Tax=Streptomyces rectiviolaceus TaxID=332591 RepID=A0ABP6M852_9ACTN
MGRASTGSGADADAEQEERTKGSKQREAAPPAGAHVRYAATTTTAGTATTAPVRPLAGTVPCHAHQPHPVIHWAHFTVATEAFPWGRRDEAG